jgi:predicted RND superfamily exporter protein
MWHHIADFVLRFRVILLVILFAITGVMGYYASKVEMSYDFTSAIPTDNPKFQDYQRFRNMFGEDGNTMMLGIQTTNLFEPGLFADYVHLSEDIGKVRSVDNVLGVPATVAIVNDSIKKLGVQPIFPKDISGANLDSLRDVFHSLPFYRGLLYNPESGAYVMAIKIDKKTLASKDRTRVINEIIALGDAFGKKHNLEMHYSGLPHIRTQMANKVQHELKIFLLLSFALTAVILMLFFRSLLAVITSMIVVAIGVIWSFGTLALVGYKITILTGVIPPLIVVIGIPNCVYFLNKYHTEYATLNDKIPALRNMVGKMGIVTLFTNLTAAIGFGVFFFTKSIILKEFGLVSGINILALFFISLVFIPAVYSYLPPPNTRHTSYLESKWMNRLLDSLTTLVFHNRKKLYLATFIVCAIAIAGMFRLKAVGHIVDDLPHSDKIYTDLKFFEKNFKGVMPLEIIVDTKKKYGALASLQTWEKLDSLTNLLEQRPEIGAGLTLIKGIKFARQGFAGGALEDYRLPDAFEFGGLKPYMISTLRKRNTSDTNQMARLLNSFVDTNLQHVRISVNVADIGSVAMPQLLNEIRPQAEQIFDTADYKLTFTGSSITFLEGSKFIINSLRESLMWAFAMILVCMVVLFRSWRIVIIAIVTNIVPLLITAGVMGWLNVPLKPSTVLVFSVALGITVDVTIRFLVNFKQELATHNEDIEMTVRRSIHDTGLSIIFTSLILMAGFAVFAVSEFDGTKSLGYLTSLTLFLAMVFNLTLQPALLLWMDKAKKKKNGKRAQ